MTLLALPPAEREEFLAEEHVVSGEVKSVTDMSARELEKAVKERDAALRQAEADRAEKDAAEQARKKMEADLTFANERLAGLREELEALKRRPVDVAVESASEEELAQARAEGEAAKAAELAELQRALEEAETARRAAEERLAAAQKAEGRTAVAADQDLAQFAVYFEQSQGLANKMHGLLLKVRNREDPSAADKLEAALRALGERIGGYAQ